MTDKYYVIVKYTIFYAPHMFKEDQNLHEYTRGRILFFLHYI
jgi:hypothetical protein